MSAPSLIITPFRAISNTLLHIFVVYLSDLANRDQCNMVQQSPHQILSDLANRDTGAIVQQSPHQILSDLANRDHCNMYNILPRTLLISNAFLVNCLLGSANYVMTY